MQRNFSNHPIGINNKSATNATSSKLWNFVFGLTRVGVIQTHNVYLIDVLFDF